MINLEVKISLNKPQPQIHSQHTFSGILSQKYEIKTRFVCSENADVCVGYLVNYKMINPSYVLLMFVVFSQEPMELCPYDPNHRVPVRSMEKHKASCSLRKMGYSAEEQVTDTWPSLKIYKPCVRIR